MKDRPLSVSRRRFLKRTGGAVAAAAAAPVILPSLARGAEAPSNRIVMASIGVGGMGTGLLHGFVGRSDTHFVAVCDVDKDAAGNAKKIVDQRYGSTDCRIYSDFREVLERDDIDAVVIATPDHWHAIPCVRAAESGKDIYCEKPLTHDLMEGRAVANAVQRHGRVFQTGSWQRSGGQFFHACELVRNGYIGKVSHIEVGLPDGGDGPVVADFPAPPETLDYEFWVGPAPWAPYHPNRCRGNWRWWLDFGGGQMMDWIGHHGDIAHMAMDRDHTGPVRIEPLVWEVSKQSNLYDAPIDYKFRCTYADGSTMDVANMRRTSDTFRAFKDTGTMFFGEDGRWIWVSRSGIKANPENLTKVRFGGNEFRFRRSSGGHHGDFIECIRDRRLPIAHVEAGHRSASIGHLGMIACQLNRELRWDPAKEQFLDNPAATRMLGRLPRQPWSA